MGNNIKAYVFFIVLVTAAVIVKDGKILIARRGNKWEFPGGKVENGESMEVCLKREIKEELGADIEVEREIGMERDGEFEIHFFLAYLKKNEYNAREHDDIKWIGIEEIKSHEFLKADGKFISRFLEREWKELE